MLLATAFRSLHRSHLSYGNGHSGISYGSRNLFLNFNYGKKFTEVSNFSASNFATGHLDGKQLCLFSRAYYSTISRLDPKGASCLVAASICSSSSFGLSVTQKRFTSDEPGYSQFGHGRKKTTAGDVFVHICLSLLFIFLICIAYKDWAINYEDVFKTKAANKTVAASDKLINRDETHSEADDDDDEPLELNGAKEIATEEKKKSKTTFRDKKIIGYENRLREFSAPEKIFRYFATLKVYPPNEPQHGPNFEVFMTPDDFVRSITPNIKQPDGLGLEQFAAFDPKQQESPWKSEPDSVFYKLGKHGLISYTDYVFLLTLLSTSSRHFALAFKMFDIDGDGELDYNEFDMVEGVIRSQTKVGAQHRDHVTTGTVLRRRTNSSLAAFFFGPNLDQKLTIDKFLDFQSHLQQEILKIEFERHDPKNGRITEVAFCKMLLQYSGFGDKEQQQMLKRVKKLYAASEKSGGSNSKDKKGNETSSNVRGISFSEVENFFRFLNDITDVDTALTFYRMAGAHIDPRTLQRVARTVARVEIPDRVIEAVFALFDENQDGELSNKEFVSVMKRRRMRGLERSKDTGLTRILLAVWRCSWDMIPVSYHSSNRA